jgi:hypothetical protein
VTGPLFFVQDSEGEVQLPDFQIDEPHPYVSAITMIAPSSDWFTGFSDFDALDATANTWYQEFEVETLPWDAGTANDNFGSEVTNMPIFVYSIDQLPSSGAFASVDGSTVLPVARWTCTLQAPPPAATAAPSAEPSAPPSVAPSVSPSASPSAQPATQPSGVQTVCLGESEPCSIHADCCGGGVCFQETCIFRRVPGVAAVSKDQFIIVPDQAGANRLRGAGRRHLL